MNSGLMDRKILIERPSYSDSAYGKGTKPSSWATLAYMWGRVTYNGGAESEAAEKKEYRETVTIQCHYIDAANVQLTDRISLDSKYWNITSKANIGRNQYIRLEAVAID